MPGRPKGPTSPTVRPDQAAGRVVEHVRRLIEDGQLHPGDRLPPERDLAVEIGVSRPSLRSGLQKLGALGVVVPRQGAGTFVSDGAPRLPNGAAGLPAGRDRLTA